MDVHKRPIVFVHVQGIVSVVVATSILAMHDQMMQIAGPLLQCQRPEYRHRLPEQRKQQSKNT